MRDDVYKEFSTKMKTIISNAMVTREVAESDLQKYTDFDLIHAGQKLYCKRAEIWNNKKELIELIEMIPHSSNNRFIDLDQIVPDSLKTSSDPEKVLKCRNTIETFVKFAQYDALITPTTDNKDGFDLTVCNFRNFPSNYQEEKMAEDRSGEEK